MKFNKWTLGLAAVGVVSMASVAKAEESIMSKVDTAVVGTILYGNVDTSVEWTPCDTGFSAFSTDGFSLGIPLRGGKANSFNLNAVSLFIEKALDESPWSSGYKVQLVYGPDAVGWNPSAGANVVRNNDGDIIGSSSGSDFAVKQAYVIVRVPVGNGLDVKIGVFDTIIGYEVFEGANNANFSRSYGYGIEPTQHVGILGTYHVNDSIALSLGIANTASTGINTRSNDEWCKTVMGSVTLSAPQSWGWMAGSTFSSGFVYGFDSALDGGTDGLASERLNIYAGLTIPTPIQGLAFGAAFDFTSFCGSASVSNFYLDSSDSIEASAFSFALYASWQATEKLSLHLRGEYLNVCADLQDYDSSGFGDSFTDITNTRKSADVLALTATLQYNLWENVISRLEVRYDTACNGTSEYTDEYNSGVFGGTSSFSSSVCEDSLSLYLNFIYKF